MYTRPFNDHSFASFLSEKRLMGSRCGGCQRLFVPPRAMCPACHGADLEWERLPETGKLVACTHMTLVAPDLAEQGYGRDNPCCVGVVELQAHVRIVARLEQTDRLGRLPIPVGLPVRVLFPEHEPSTEKPATHTHPVLVCVPDTASDAQRD